MKDKNPISEQLEFILKKIDQNRWISFPKGETDEVFKAKDKLRALGLIERHGKLSWQLTEEGYNAVEVGGFVNVQSAENLETRLFPFF